LNHGCVFLPVRSNDQQNPKTNVCFPLLGIHWNGNVNSLSEMNVTRNVL
jgi:hypothetical protein